MGIHIQRDENKALELRTQHLVGDHTDFNQHCPSCQEEAGVDQFTGEETAAPDENWDELVKNDVGPEAESVRERHGSMFSQLAHKKYTAAEVKNIIAAGPACDYVPGGRNGRKGAISTCGNSATHFVFTQNLNPEKDPTGQYNYWEEDTPGHFACEKHADDAVADVDDDQFNDLKDRTPGASDAQLQRLQDKFGKKIHLNDVDSSFIGTSRHKDKRYQHAYTVNLATYRSKAFKGSKEDENNFTDMARLSEPLENETPAQHLVRQAVALDAKSRATNALAQSNWRLRTKLGVEQVPLEKPGRKIPRDASGKTEVRTRDVRQALDRAENILRHVGDPILEDENATVEEKLYRAQIHAASGLKFSGVNQSREMIDNPSGTRTPGSDQRLINRAPAVSPRNPFTSYGIAPTEDITGLMSTGANIFGLSAGPDRMSALDTQRLDAPKFVNDEGKTVDYTTGEENHPGISIIDTDRGIVDNENPYRLTIKKHPQAGLITTWKGQVVHVHQIPHTQHFYKLLSRHGLENIGRLPAEAFGRQLTDPVTGNPKYLYVPSTTPVNFQMEEGKDASKLPELIKKEYAKTGTLSHQQNFEQRLMKRGESAATPIDSVEAFRKAAQATQRVSSFLEGSDD